ncbi:MAG: apolipoprotein N-acyltransferase [Spirochaetaceae bacterium]|nr:MAG: apolipoprotein N-acyltransferase [Spirochaetaceae bacterium]
MFVVWLLISLVYAGAVVPGVLFVAGERHWLVIALHALAAVLAVLLAFSNRRERLSKYFITYSWALLVFVLALASFRYFFAMNANLEYVQRIAEHGGIIDLAKDTASERGLVFRQFGGYILAGLVGLILSNLASWKQWRRPPSDLWAFPLALIGGIACTLALPNGFFVNGIPALAFFAMLPLFIIIEKLDLSSAWRYGMLWAFTFLLLSNYWLATFSLVSLQVAVGIYSAYYFLLIPLLVSIKYLGKSWRFVLWALALLCFDYMRTLGFLGYPWNLLAHSQYQNPVVLQIAEITGVWGIAGFVFLVNAGIAQLIFWRSAVNKKVWVLPVGLILILCAGVLGFGYHRLATSQSRSGQDAIRIALIQQNTDPRQADYAFTFSILKALSLEAAATKPDLIVWGETAFVPNIRRWGEAGSEGGYSSLVKDFLGFLQDMGIALLTGNDDYSIELDEQGKELERNHYNAAVLFDEKGQRMATYHKRRLVPFTEYFPYGRLFPGVERTLEAYGVTFWEPGIEPAVFQHKGLKFATPICFEDIFPSEVRESVLQGAAMIINLTNDYWSLNPVQAEQHFAASVFRAVENRVPLVRAAVSGKTAVVDPDGQVLAALPEFTRDFLVADVQYSQAAQQNTIYTRFGDWLPIVCMLLLLMAVARWALSWRSG